MKKNITQNIKSIIIILLLVIGVGYVSANFTAPHSTPPTCITDPTNPNYDPGCLAPINVGSLAQTKNGSLQTGGLGILGSFAFLPITIAAPLGVPPTSGQVLMADDSDLAHGKVKWGASADAVYDSHWVAVTTGQMSFLHNLGTSALAVQVFVSPNQSGAPNFAASSYKGFDSRIGSGSGGVWLTSIDNTNINLNVDSQKQIADPTQHLSNTFKLDQFNWIRVIAKKATFNDLVGARLVYGAWGSGQRWVDIRYGTVNGDCPPGSFKRYGDVVDNNPVITGDTVNGDNPFTCIESIP